MALYRNRYTCHECRHEWSVACQVIPDDECPKCHAIHCSPHTSTLVKEETDAPKEASPEAKPATGTDDDTGEWEPIGSPD